MDKAKEVVNFPDWYTIDALGIDSLIYFLKKEYDGQTIKISVEKEKDSKC
jgi:hypothetical protein